MAISEDDCDACGGAALTTGLCFFGSGGAQRIALCRDCAGKARKHDAETWERINAVLST